MATEPLYLVRASMRVDRLMQLGAERGMKMADVDPGYAVHLALGELFDAEAPGVFRVREPKGGRVEVLAYAGSDADALRERAGTFCHPLAHAACDWDGFVSRPMPSAWPAGRRLGFELRTCPVRRGRDAERRRWEKDAFLVACDHAPRDAGLDRDTVYLDWLDELLGRADGLTVERRKLTSYRRVRLWRRTQGRGRNGREGRRIERPDALFHGVLQVTDGDAFAATLRRGIGRHRGFGFGMLLLAPPTDRAC